MKFILITPSPLHCRDLDPLCRYILNFYNICVKHTQRFSTIIWANLWLTPILFQNLAKTSLLPKLFQIEVEYIKIWRVFLKSISKTLRIILRWNSYDFTSYKVQSITIERRTVILILVIKDQYLYL